MIVFFQSYQGSILTNSKIIKLLRALYLSILSRFNFNHICHCWSVLCRVLSILSRFNFNICQKTNILQLENLSILSRFNFNPQEFFCYSFCNILSILSRFNFNHKFGISILTFVSFQSYQGSILTYICHFNPLYSPPSFNPIKVQF